jgi:hypothetical protein
MGTPSGGLPCNILSQVVRREFVLARGCSCRVGFSVLLGKLRIHAELLMLGTGVVPT